MSLICNDYRSGSVSVELSRGLDDLIELYKKQCDSQSLPHHCLSYLISISYYVIVCIYTLPWHWLLPSNREDVQEVEYRMHTAQRKGYEARMRKPSHHSGILFLSSCGASASFLSFCRLPLSALSAQRKRWLRPGTQQGMTRASEFPGEMFGLLGCSSEGLREGELWTVLSLQWHLHHEFSALQFLECFPETLTILILPQVWEWMLLVPSLYILGNWGSVGIHS